MIEGNDCAIGVIEPLRAAFTRYLVISAYLYVFFSATELYEAARLAEQGARFVPPRFALAKALSLGKSVLIGESGRVGAAG